MSHSGRVAGIGLDFFVLLTIFLTFSKLRESPFLRGIGAATTHELNDVIRSRVGNRVAYIQVCDEEEAGGEPSSEHGAEEVDRHVAVVSGDEGEAEADRGVEGASAHWPAGAGACGHREPCAARRQHKGRRSGKEVEDELNVRKVNSLTDGETKELIFSVCGCGCHVKHHKAERECVAHLGQESLTTRSESLSSDAKDRVHANLRGFTSTCCSPLERQNCPCRLLDVR